MAQVVTLELSEEAARRAEEAARRTGRRVDEVLTTWIERAARSDAASEMTTGAEYSLLTPYGNEAAAQTLLAVLRAAETADDAHSAAP